MTPGSTERPSPATPVSPGRTSASTATSRSTGRHSEARPDSARPPLTGDAWFPGADITGEAGFREATFKASACFIGATFHHHARFEAATFTGEAAFDGATFTGEADFIMATFSDDAGFRKATFHRDARFDGATFSSGADALSFTEAHVPSSGGRHVRHVWPRGWRSGQDDSGRHTVVRTTANDDP